MRSWKSLLLLGVFISTAAVSNFVLGKKTDRSGQRLQRYFIEVPMRSPFDGRQLIGWLNRNGYDVAGSDWQAGTIEVITDQQGIDRLNQRGLRGSALQNFVGAGANAIDPRYLNPQKVEDLLKSLNARFPEFTRLERIGVSLQGRPIWALLISSTPRADDPRALEKPAIIFDGLHHAREIMTPEIVMDVAPTLLNGFKAGVPGARQALLNWNVWIVPMLNVDGNSIVWGEDAWWRKNARGAQSSIYGVDINRNYPFKWNSCGGSSGSSGAQDYRGESPGSEPETQALARLGQWVQPTASLSYHSYSELILYPYGCSSVLTGENALIEKIAEEMATLLPRDRGRGNYATGTPWQILYSVDGDSMSYMHAEFGALAYTFEVNQNFQPPYELREPTLQKHRKAWQYFLTRMDNNMLSIQVIDGKTGAPAVAALEFSNIPRTYGEKAFRTNAGGNHFKVLDPGRYNLRATLADGRRAEAVIEMNGRPQSLRVVVQ
ncbi:MAG: hypothetical protein KF865_08785 [Bdellovibrionaceae bacterium]|nr:hypothetical protein [Pseudobdellovibrionaceae bacterium]